MYFNKICGISQQKFRFSTGIYIAYLKGDPPTSSWLSLNSPGYEIFFKISKLAWDILLVVSERKRLSVDRV